jgi:hypothetical protein
MFKLTVAVLAIVLAGSASAAGWRDLRVDGSSEAAFAASLAAFKDKLSSARAHVFGEALKDIWVKGSLAAEAETREYTAEDYYRQVDGLRYEEIVKFTDPTGDTARKRYLAASQRPRFVPVSMPSRPAPIGPHGEQDRGLPNSGPAYQHQLSTMGQR